MPIARQLVAQLRSLIVSGALAPGLRLPPSRDLSHQLAVGRNAAVHAYEQLRAEGWIEARGRHGTFIANRKRPAGTQVKSPTLIARLAPSITEASPPWMDWRIGRACTVALPLDVWRAACREAGRHIPPSDYGDPRGDASLRAAVSRWLALRRGVDVDPRDIVITQGAGQAIDLLARLLVRPGDVCAVENPGYRRAARAFSNQGASLRLTEVDNAGMNVAQAFAGGAKPALLHVTAAHQYPLGMRLSGTRRRELLALARSAGSLIVENEYDHEFVHSGPNHAPLQASAPDRVILVSTFAKAVSPALRIGFIVAPPVIAHQLAEQIAEQRCHVSWPIQKSIAWLIDSGELERHLRRVHRHEIAQLDKIKETLADLGPRIRITGDAGGLHLVLQTSSAARDAALQKALRRAGIAIDTLGDFVEAPTPRTETLFAYGHMSSSDLRQALATLRSAISK